MNPEVQLVATVLFWILTAMSILLPPRYGILAYIILVQFDLTGVAFYADSSLGWENAIKTVLIPTIIFLRMRPIDLLPTGFSAARNFWILLVAYAALAVAWSPYRLSGVKMMGYFYSYSILFLIFAHAWRRRWFTSGSFVLVASVSLALAVLQTYLLGNTYGDVDGEGRFTSFSDAQSFAPFLICLIIVLILCVKRTWPGWIVAAAALIGFVATGSRSYFVGFAWVVLIMGIALGKRFRHKLSIPLIIKSVVIGGVTISLLAVVILRSLPQNRLNELTDVLTTRNASLNDVETFAWRLTIYAKTIQELAGRTVPRFIVGSGTSSGATVALETGFFTESNVDPNRCIHDEFLRSLYEWGALGFLAFVCFLGAIFRLSFRLARLTQANQAWACLAVSGPLFIGLLIENILADGASPGGVGFCLVFAAMIAQLRPAAAKVKVAHEPILRPSNAIGQSI